MKCYRCKRLIEDTHWHSETAQGMRHLTCPNPNGQSAQRRRRMAARYRAEKRRLSRASR